MRNELRQALAECLSRLEAGETVEACLRDRPQLAKELRPLLEAAAGVRGLPVEPYSPQAFHAGKARLRSSLAAATPAHGAWAPLRRTGLVVATAALIAVVALLAFTTDLFRPGSTPTEAHVTGVLSSFNQGALVVATSRGPVTINVTDTTKILDPKGQAQTPEQIAPGDHVRIRVDEDNEGHFTAEEVELEEDEDGGGGDDLPGTVEVEFKGTVQSLTNGGDLTLATSFGIATVHVLHATEVKGTLTAGVTVKVHANREADGTFTAREIEVTDGRGDEGGDDGSGPDGGDAPDGGGDSDSSGPGSGDDSGSGGDGAPDDGEPESHD